jgi:AraC-like DNA-binding protein
VDHLDQGRKPPILLPPPAGEEIRGGAPGETVVVDRLADILLVQALRAHLAATGPQQASWLAGLADPRIGRALRSFHDDVAADWTVARLAAAAGMSRSSFAERFQARVGLAPLDYLTRWRLYRVRRALIDTDLAFATIAARNGYRSRTSCSQSFKRMFGYSPYDLRTARAAQREHQLIGLSTMQAYHPEGGAVARSQPESRRRVSTGRHGAP